MAEEGLIFPTTTTMLSTRELGAKLWEILPQPRVRSISSKNKDTPSSSPPVLPAEMADSGLIVGRTSPSSFQTSTEFLNMLNRIWNMEEQHSSNLKTELDQSRARIIELARDKQKLDPLVKKKKKKKKEESVLMDDEREFRKLAQEVSELRISLSDALKNLDKERDYRILLEDICDEFAKGVRDYENELQTLKREIGDKHQVHRESCHDMLILHLSQAWIDERMCR